MNRIILLSIFLIPLVLFCQRTYIPDDSFEQILINYGYDDIFDDSVNTSSIDTVQVLYIDNEGISDLTGIEDFYSLTQLFCHNNQIQELDLSNNPNLFEVNCRFNQLVSLSVKNGNPTGLWYFRADQNPSLLCVEVDNVAYAYYNWIIDNTAVFSTNCTVSAIGDINTKKRLIKIVDVMGRNKKSDIIGSPLFYIYDDGTVQKILKVK